MTEKARRCIDWVIRVEGGDRLVDDPDDPGGPTRFGISQRAHPTLDVRGLTREQAVAIYEREYWNAIRGDELPEPLALALLDFAVHGGPRRAWRRLAELLGLPRDANPAAVLLRARDAKDPRGLAIELVAERAAALARRGIAVPGQHKWVRGWVGRMVDLKRAVESAPA